MNSLSSEIGGKWLIQKSRTKIGVPLQYPVAVNNFSGNNLRVVYMLSKLVIVRL